MNRDSSADIYRCDLCRGSVDRAERDRARRAWQPLIICDRCVRDAEARWSGARQVAPLAHT